MFFDRRAMRNFIENSGIKQKYVAGRAGIDESSLSLILSGKRKCAVDEYLRLCVAMDVDILQFIVNESANRAS